MQNHLKTPEKKKAASARWRARNRVAARVTTALWRQANPDHARKQSRDWAISNPIKMRAIIRISVAKRRAAATLAGGSFSISEEIELLRKQKFKCTICGKKLGDDYHRDHHIPIVRGGSSYIRNIELVHPSCNRKKSAKDPIAFAQEMGRLL